MERKPYLDKICHNPHMPHVEGYNDMNSKTTFPDLKHTGIRSKFDAPSVIVTTPTGRLTADFKQQSYLRVKGIYRDDVEMNSREAIYKRSHKQFLSDILLDMEEKKHKSVERRLQHWTTKKTELGFSDQFNAGTTAGDHPSENRPETSFSNNTNNFINNNDNSTPGTVLNPHQQSRASTAAVTTTTSKRDITTANSSRTQRAVNREILFKNLLETLEPPTSPTKRFGSMSSVRK
jgi:hypothetical protein